ARPWRKTKASEAGSGSGSQFSSHTAVESHRVVSGTDSLISVRENRGVITPVSAGRDTQRPAQRQNRNILVTGDPASAEVSQAEALDSGMRVAISSGESRGIRTPEDHAEWRDGSRRSVTGGIAEIVVGSAGSCSDPRIDIPDQIIGGVSTKAYRQQQQKQLSSHPNPVCINTPSCARRRPPGAEHRRRGSASGAT